MILGPQVVSVIHQQNKEIDVVIAVIYFVAFNCFDFFLLNCCIHWCFDIIFQSTYPTNPKISLHRGIQSSSEALTKSVQLEEYQSKF